MRYEPARWDTRVGSCTPGGRALINWAHRNRFSDKGCFNDRAVRGLGTPSLHREGRAVDLTPGRRTWTDFDQLVHQLVEHHQTLQIQQVIWNRRVWTVGRNWRAYSGSAGPHLDHAHVELTWHGARHLTVELIDATLSTEDDEMEVTVPSSDRIDVFARGDNGEVWHRWFSLKTFSWSEWESLGGQCVGAPSATWFHGSLSVFVRGTDDALWQRTYTPSGGWGDWVRLGGTLTSAPAVAVG